MLPSPASCGFPNLLAPHQRANRLRFGVPRSPGHPSPKDCFPFDMEEILVKANASASRLVATGQLMAGRAPPGAMSTR